MARAGTVAVRVERWTRAASQVLFLPGVSREWPSSETEPGCMKSERIGDRRAEVRFQVVGTMPASLQATDSLRVVNLGVAGALVEGPVPLTENAEYRMQLVLPGHVAEVLARVRRIAVVRPSPGVVAYRIGLEFLGVSADGREFIGDFVAAAGARL